MKLPDTVGFELGQEVYHRTEPEKMGMVIGIHFTLGGTMIRVQWATNFDNNHYPAELVCERVYEGTGGGGVEGA